MPVSRLLRLTSLLALLAGCSSAGAPASERVTPDSSRAVTQGGAADIAQFRAIVDEGRVPAPDVLDPVGFFAEHAVDLPPADCGQDVCVHQSLAVAPRFDGTHWTMAYVAMNTPVDPASVSRRDTHLVLVVERTARIDLASSAALREMLIALRPTDRVTVLGYDATVDVLADRVQSTDPALASLPLNGAADQAALYDALGRAAALLGDDEELAGRVILLTSGLANAGLNDADRIENLAGALGQSGVPVSVIGAGRDYEASLPARIAEAGGGSLYFAQNGDDLRDVLAIEAQTALTPLATDFELRLEPAPGYRIGRVFGARRAVLEPGAATLASPVLMIGNRSGSDDVEQGRRGGGGGFFIELLVEDGADVGRGAPAFTVRASWTAASSGERQSHEATVDNALAPGEVPSGMWPSFSDPTRGKPFMMINLYFALTLSVELFHTGDCAGALGVEPMLEPAYDGWQAEYSDPDIDADWTLLRAIHTNMQSQCSAVEPVPPSQGNHSVSCMFI